ncbi:GroES-like protein [Xylariaceae sp. FL0255]|nr:GroES-like protein [Xylariaceae sp. FL0255]
MPVYHGAMPEIGVVLVKAAFTSVNPLDYKAAEAPIMGARVFKGVPCLDFAGTVVALSNGASKDKSKGKDSRINASDRVFGQTQPMNFGACAEYIVVSEDLCMPMPDDRVSLTAYQSVVPFIQSKQPSSRTGVFINGGSGGLGTFAIQFAKSLGYHVTTACSAANADLCWSIGADEIIDYKSQNILEALKASEQSYDIVVDYIFADSRLYWASHEFPSSDGVYVKLVGGLSFPFIKDLLTIKLWPTFLNGNTKRRFQLVGRVTSAKDYDQIATWISKGFVKPVMEQVYEIEEVRAAFARIKSGRTRGKLVIRIAPRS